MSHSTLYRKIKGLTEMSVNEYVRKIKMKKGMELINEGKYSLAEISDLTGFSSVAYFRQCFKDEYGMAPTEYLKRKQKLILSLYTIKTINAVRIFLNRH